MDDNHLLLDLLVQVLRAGLLLDHGVQLVAELPQLRLQQLVQPAGGLARPSLGKDLLGDHTCKVKSHVKSMHV